MIKTCAFPVVGPSLIPGQVRELRSCKLLSKGGKKIPSVRMQIRYQLQAKSDI